ncbi:ATP-binding cassette domain-containing protein [Nocardioides lijunqiniae]|uniref:ATP-binding cassette domain-containing protein n=1 Tax=Nocardioides lijunqiniae TaxID=2760832 RepID=UPI0018789C2A
MSAPATADTGGTAGQELLRADAVVKRYGPVTVLRGASLDVVAGRVDGLIGRNGAGKSTLVNVLAGRVHADGGRVLLEGRPVDLRTPADALAHGIVAVPQEIVMPMDMTVTEVVTFGAEPGRGGVLARRTAERRVRELMDGLGLPIDVRARVRDLPVSWQRVVLLAQALHREARVLILDEPTAAMNADDSARVLSVVRRLRDRGLGIVFISHRFDEVQEACDRVTALADGEVIDVMDGAEVTHDRLVAAITGPESAMRKPRVPDTAAVVTVDHDHAGALEVRELRGERLDGLDLDVRPGEVVGIAGLPGSGVAEVFEHLAGRRRAASGSIRVGDRTVTSERSATRLGIGLLPASRRSAAMTTEPVLENVALPALAACGRRGVVSTSSIRRRSADIVDRLSLRPVAERRMGQLSGGNQQRVLVAAKLLAGPRFLLLEDPTVGVDIAARAELHALLRSLAAEGLGLLVGSSEPEELLEICDRVVVLRRGRVELTSRAEDLSEYELVGAMTGSAPATTG